MQDKCKICGRPNRHPAPGRDHVCLISNHHWRQFLYLQDLTPAERSDLGPDDYIDRLDDFSPVFRYRGAVYTLDDFMRIPAGMFEGVPGTWHGYHSDSFFSGILIELHPYDSDFYRVATYIS